MSYDSYRNTGTHAQTHTNARTKYLTFKHIVEKNKVLLVLRVHPSVVLSSDVVLFLLLLTGLLLLHPDSPELPVLPQKAGQTFGLPTSEVRLESDHLVQNRYLNEKTKQNTLLLMLYSLMWFLVA